MNTGSRKAKANTLPMVMRAPPTSAPPCVMLSFFAVAIASSTVFVPMSVCDSNHACSFPPSAPTFSCKPGKLWLKCAAWVRMKYDSPAAQAMASSTVKVMPTKRFRPWRARKFTNGFSSRASSSAKSKGTTMGCVYTRP